MWGLKFEGLEWGVKSFGFEYISQWSWHFILFITLMTLIIVIQFLKFAFPERAEPKHIFLNGILYSLISLK